MYTNQSKLRNGKYDLLEQYTNYILRKLGNFCYRSNLHILYLYLTVEFVMRHNFTVQVLEKYGTYLFLCQYFYFKFLPVNMYKRRVAKVELFESAAGDFYPVQN